MITNESKGKVFLGTEKIHLEDAIEWAEYAESTRMRVSLSRPQENLRLERDGNSLSLAYKQNGLWVETRSIRQSALTQLCQRAGIRAGFIDDCIKFGIPETAVSAFDDYMNRERTTGQKNVPQDLDLIIQTTLIGSAEPTEEQILGLGKVSRWDIINAATYAAHEKDSKNADRTFSNRLKMEMVAGRLLTA